MIWLTWRQARAQVVVLAVVVAALAAGLALTGEQTAGTDAQAFLSRLRLDRVYPTLYLTASLVCLVAPALIGAFWGAPLVARELETGTYRLAWNQGVSRTRWLAVKLGGLVLTAAALMTVLSLAFTWWAGPIDRAVGTGAQEGLFGLPRIAPVVFSARGIVPVAYTVLAVTVGALLGLLVRRTVAALALTLLVVLAIQIAVPLFVRAHLATPERRVVTITADNLRGLMVAGDPGQGDVGRVKEIRVDVGLVGVWELANRTIDRAGNVQRTLPGDVAKCGLDPMQVQLTAPSKEEIDQRRQACFDKLAAGGFRQEVTWQPASRFWTLQWRETALLLVVAAAAAGACFARIRR